MPHGPFGSAAVLVTIGRRPVLGIKYTLAAASFVRETDLAAASFLRAPGFFTAGMPAKQPCSQAPLGSRPRWTLCFPAREAELRTRSVPKRSLGTRRTNE